MKSLAYIPASDGSGDASLMTITQVRTAPATSITVNTVAGVPNKFFGAMGTPHTFTDPVTGEIITVISESTAVNFAGHVDSGKIEIDAIADGEADLGSKVGDIIIIRPTTQWADNLHNVLAESHNDDGTLKPDIVKKENIPDGELPASKIDSATFKFGNYSLAEEDTGFKWVDGKPVFRRTFTGSVTSGANTVNTGVIIASGAGFDQVIAATGFWRKNNNNEWVSLGGGWNGSNLAAIGYTKATGNLQIISTSDAARTSAPYYVTIEYTKS